MRLPRLPAWLMFAVFWFFYFELLFLSYGYGKHVQQQRDVTPFDIEVLQTTEQLERSCKSTEDMSAIFFPVPPSQREQQTDRWLIQWYKCQPQQDSIQG